jgi:hypothetical protein
LITTLTISGYGGTDIFNCTSLHDLPGFIVNELVTDGSTFYLTDGGAHYQEFIYKLSDQSATPTGSMLAC